MCVVPVRIVVPEPPLAYITKQTGTMSGGGEIAGNCELRSAHTGLTRILAIEVIANPAVPDVVVVGQMR
jgi:hypothetical protein